MYVIEDKKGRFLNDAWKWSKILKNARQFNTKRRAILHCWAERGERVFEVKMVLGKQVK